MSLTVKERRMNCLKVFAGRTIMTTEPKFVPNQAVSIEVDEGLEVNIRLVDCVDIRFLERRAMKMRMARA